MTCRCRRNNRLSLFSSRRNIIRLSLILSGTLLKDDCFLVSARKTRLTWINGIAYNLDHMLQGQRDISKYFAGKPVIFCHNPTAMVNEEDMKGYISDLTQAGQQKLGRITEEVDTLVKHLRESVAAVGKDGCVVHIAHSQGALITFLAAQQLTPDEMRQIEVVAFGGAAAIRSTPKTPFKRCINYYSVNDPLLYVVPEANQALRSGFAVGKNEEFCFLAPRGGDPLVDHNLVGPTYSQALKWEGDRYQRLYVSPTYKYTRALLLLIRAVLDLTYKRLQVILKWILKPLVVWCLLAWQCIIRARNRFQRNYEERFLSRIVFLLALSKEWLSYMKRSWTGEEQYQPVSTVLQNVDSS